VTETAFRCTVIAAVFVLGYLTGWLVHA